MSSAKKGFLLPDALVSVFLVSVMVLLVSGAVQVHFHGDRIIESINGSRTNVIGLPVEMVQELISPP